MAAPQVGVRGGPGEVRCGEARCGEARCGEARCDEARCGEARCNDCHFVLLSLHPAVDSLHNGAWCDENGGQAHRFICEAGEL